MRRRTFEGFLEVKNEVVMKVKIALRESRVSEEYVGAGARRYAVKEAQV